MRKGLSLFYRPADPKTRTGIHRDQSGVDHRKARFTVDYDNLLTKEWPEPLDELQPFLLGLVEGAKSCLDDQWVRFQVEAGFKSAMAKALRDPLVGDLYDGALAAVQRILQGLRDNGLLLTAAEWDRAQRAGELLAELSRQKGEFLGVIRAASVEIEGGGTPRRAGFPHAASS